METNTQHTQHHSENQNEQLFASLAYIIFFLPLIFTPKSDFAKYHANQGLILLACWFGLSFLLTVTLVGIILMPLVQIAGIVFIVLGIMNVTKNKKEPLPIIGNLFTLIK